MNRRSLNSLIYAASKRSVYPSISFIACGLLRSCLSFEYFEHAYSNKRASLVVQMVKNLHAMQETWVQSLGWEDPLEKGMAAHSSILAWRIPWMEEPGGLQSMALQRVRHD